MKFILMALFFLVGGVPCENAIAGCVVPLLPISGQEKPPCPARDFRWDSCGQQCQAKNDGWNCRDACFNSCRAVCPLMKSYSYRPLKHHMCSITVESPAKQNEQVTCITHICGKREVRKVSRNQCANICFSHLDKSGTCKNKFRCTEVYFNNEIRGNNCDYAFSFEGKGVPTRGEANVFTKLDCRHACEMAAYEAERKFDDLFK